MSVFLYRERPTFLHRLHPATKVIGLLLGFALALSLSHPVPALGAVVLAAVALIVGGGLSSLTRAWKFLLLLFVMTTLIWSVFLRISGPMGKGGVAAFTLGFTVSPEVAQTLSEDPTATVLVSLSGKTIYAGGKGHVPADGMSPVVEISGTTVAYGAAMGLRIVACIIFGLAFLTCTRTEDFAAALRLFGAPQGVSVAVSLAFRLVPVLAGTARNVIEAQQARGVEPESGNLFRRFRNYVPLITPVLAYALRGADMTAMALESRGLGASPATRTYYREFAAGAADVMLLAAMAALLVACLWLRSQGYGVIIFAPDPALLP